MVSANFILTAPVAQPAGAARVGGRPGAPLGVRDLGYDRVVVVSGAEAVLSQNGELEAAIGAARAAGEVLRDGFGRHGAVRYKGEVDIVTDVDERSEGVIKERLRGAFPGYGILAEEGGALAGEGDARWIVDPLDGTVNFAHGLPIFVVSIALERAGEVTLGVVHDPMNDETFVAERGGGATLNGEPLRVSGTEELVRALLVTGFPYDRANVPAALELFARFSVLAQGMRRLGAPRSTCATSRRGGSTATTSAASTPGTSRPGPSLSRRPGARSPDTGGKRSTCRTGRCSRATASCIRRSSRSRAGTTASTAARTSRTRREAFV